VAKSTVALNVRLREPSCHLAPPWLLPSRSLLSRVSEAMNVGLGLGEWPIAVVLFHRGVQPAVRSRSTDAETYGLEPAQVGDEFLGRSLIRDLLSRRRLDRAGLRVFGSDLILFLVKLY
jgi:hypothetical protein